MTIRHIRIFLTLIENGCNMSLTAEELNMSQPAVSIAIKELENHYGVRLFERLSHRLVLTEAGRMFRDSSRHILSIFEEMERKCRNWNNEGRLRIGASMTIGARFLPSYISGFSALHPSLEIYSVVNQSAKLEELLLSDSIDIALVEGMNANEQFVVRSYMDDNLVCLCSASSGPFQDGSTVSLDDFCRCRFLLRERGSGTRDEFDYACRKAGFSIKPVLESISTTAIVECVIAGIGVAVLPYRLVEGAVKSGKVVIFRVEGLELKRQFRILYHKDKFLSENMKEFISYVEAFHFNSSHADFS